MPIKLRLGPDLGLIVMKFEGVVTSEQFSNRLAPLWADSEIRTLPLALVDLMGVEVQDVPTELIRNYARTAGEVIDREIGGPAKMAIAATHDELFGLGRMYGMLRGNSPVDVGVFRTLQEAERWLELPPHYASDLVELGDPAS